MPNTMQEAVYSQYFNSVVKMAQRDGGVSRPELIHSLGVSRTVADGLIARCKLRHSSTKGKTEFFSISRGSKKVLEQAGDAPETKETTMTDQSPSPTDAKGLVASVVGDDQPAPPAKGKKSGKNRLPKEDQGAASAPAAPSAPAIAPSAAPTAPVGIHQKTAVELDQEIMAINSAIKEATNKSNSAFQVHLAQKAHAEALGDRLKVVIAARLNATV